MTAYTTPDGLPYPGQADRDDPADTPVALQELAEAVQDTFIAVKDTNIHAGAGLTGGGDLTNSRTLAVNNGTGISVGGSPSKVSLNLGYTDARYQAKFAVGRKTGVTVPAPGATGDITIAHGLGRTPTAVFVSVDDDTIGSCSIFVNVRAFNSTNIFAQARNIDSGTSDGVGINWIAF